MKRILALSALMVALAIPLQAEAACPCGCPVTMQPVQCQPCCPPQLVLQEVQIPDPCNPCCPKTAYIPRCITGAAAPVCCEPYEDSAWVKVNKLFDFD